MSRLAGARAMFGTARVLVAEIAATSPRNAAEGSAWLLPLTISEGVGVLLLAPLLELVGVMDDNPLPRAAGWLDAGFAAIGVQPTLGPVLLLFVAVAALRAVIERREGRLFAAVREDLTSAYRVRIYRAMAAAEWRSLVARTPSEFAHALTSEIGRVGSAVLQMTELAVALMVSLVYLGLALKVSPAMALVVLGSAGALAWSVRGTLDRARAVGARSSATRSRMHAAIAEHVASMKTARSYGALDRHFREFAELSRRSRDVSLEVAAGEADLQHGLELGSTVLLALIVYVAAKVLRIPPALLLVLMYIFARLMPRLIASYRLVQSLTMALPVVETVLQLERDCLAAAEPPASADAEVTFQERLRFENVSFGYLGRGGDAAIVGLDLTIDAGVTTAIVGPSGSGKSTIADLLIGLLSPVSGRLLIDGQVLDSNGMASWRRQIGYVSQETFLFDDTVRGNLRWAHPGAADADLWAALRLAVADRFVESLPQGLDTIVGERGVLLSGGERQRLSIARALLRQPRILVLDEATSSLDLQNERRIQEALDALQHRMTIVVITHRLSTIRYADVIHVIDGGRVVQSGTWEQLNGEPDGRFSALARLPVGAVALV